MLISSSIPSQTMVNLSDIESGLTDGEVKIIRALERLERLWEKHGSDLILYNGHSLRKFSPSADHEIASFPGIRGDGGDGGDSFTP